MFEGLSIWEEEAYQKLQGTYPVIFLSFAGVKETSFLENRKSICRSMEELYNKHDYLLEGDLLYEKEKLFYQEACVNGYWQELAAFIRSLFNFTFKTNPYLERAVMTGITRVSKESVFSDLNNLKVVTTTSGDYSASFGFPKEETFASLEEYGLGSEKENFEILMQRGVIISAIDEQIVYNQLDEDEDAIWSLLLAGGYLKVLSVDDTPMMQGMGAVEYEKSLQETAASALRQIEMREYAQELINRGIATERIRSYGVAFEGKKVLIR